MRTAPRARPRAERFLVDHGVRASEFKPLKPHLPGNGRKDRAAGISAKRRKEPLRERERCLIWMLRPPFSFSGGGLFSLAELRAAAPPLTVC